MIYRGSVDCRQDAEPIDGRADIIQAEVARRGGAASMVLDLAATTVTKAASSASVGVPRTTLTSGSVSIDRAYDAPGDIR